MRGLRMVGVVGVLSAAALTVTAHAGAGGHGSGHGSHGHGGMHGGGQPSHIGVIFAIEMETQSKLFHGEPQPGPAAPGVLMAGGPEHRIAGDLVGPSTHPAAHVVVRGERGEVLSSQPTAPTADESDQAGAATAQPNPTASPSSPRPPGAAGPGKLVVGWPGPGLPGPGRPANPGW
jgi:hypothetical protein